MNFDFSEEQIMIRQAARDFAKSLSPMLLSAIVKPNIPHNTLKSLAI